MVVFINIECLKMLNKFLFKSLTTILFVVIIACNQTNSTNINFVELQTINVIDIYEESQKNIIRARQNLIGQSINDRFVVNEILDNSVKLFKIQEIGSDEHIDDDIQTIQLLNERANCKLFFRKWKYNQKFSVAKNIKTIDDFNQLTQLIN